MSSHPISHAFVHDATNTHDAPNRSVNPRSHLDEIRRLIGDCRSEGCLCGAAGLYAEFNNMERRMEALRRQHRTLSGPGMNDGLQGQQLAVLPSVATSHASTSQSKSSYAEATASAVDLWPLNGLATTQADSDNPTDDRRDHITPLVTNGITREREEPSQASINRGRLNTQPRLSDLPPSQDASQLAPRQEDHHTGASRKRKWSQLQDPSTATNRLDSVVGIEAGSNGLARAPKRLRPSITADIREAAVAREVAQDRESMIEMWGPPVYGLVDIRDRIGARVNALADADAPMPAPARVIRRHRPSLRDLSPRTPSKPKVRRRGEVEVLRANMTRGERETYASTVDAAQEPRRRLRSTRVRNMRV